MKTLEQDIREALTELQGEALEARRGPCPEEELLGLYAEGSLTGPEKDRVQEHLSIFPDCLEVVLLVVSCDTEQAPKEVPHPIRAELVEKAKSLVEPGADKMLFDLVVRFFREGLEVIHSSLNPLPPLHQPVAAALRGDEKTNLSESLRMEKHFDSIVAEVEVSAPREGMWSVQVILRKAEQNSPLDGLRVTLKDKAQEKELQSLLVRKGVATFLGLPCGEYALEVMDKGCLHGELSLCLSET